MTKQERIEQVRAKLDERLKREQPVSVGREPRYDAVFFEGTAWLDRLALKSEEQLKQGGHMSSDEKLEELWAKQLGGLRDATVADILKAPANKPRQTPSASFGSETLPGLAKLLEEAGEVLQVGGEGIGDWGPLPELGRDTTKRTHGSRAC